MRIGIVGSRPRTDPTTGRWDALTMERHAAVRAYLDALPRDGTIEIVTGGAEGVDSIAELHAIAIGLKVDVMRAPWTRLGLGAGFHRSVALVARVGRLVTFWDGVSPGTAHAITEARARGIEHVIGWGTTTTIVRRPTP